MIYPDNYEKKIGFDEVRRLVASHCQSPLGQEEISRLAFSSDIYHVRHRLSEVADFLKIIHSGEDFPSDALIDLRAGLQRIRLEGTYLEAQEFFDLSRTMQTLEAMVRFLRRGSSDEIQEVTVDTARYPSLFRMTADIMVFPMLTRQIMDVIDKYGQVRDSASSQLAQIRHELSRTAGSISHTLNSILRAAQSEGVVDKDVTPTMRDNRLVIPVTAGLKRRIHGIVHDESASGKTVFIEPTEVVEANNRIRELMGEERREVIRILHQLTDTLRPHVPAILHAYTFLARMDAIRAKARWAETNDAAVPVVSNRPLMDWVQAVHPLLRLSLEKHGGKVVPLDITLTDNQRILIISGPNAGGKSVCLKTVGLLQYMLQCGLPIPVRENSHTGIFNSIFIDIGDEQSIDDDLSTYSSHLLNMKLMMRHSDARSLLLIDEFGGGTEPQIGGAMAEAILSRFNHKQAWGIITTHYQNLKHYADAHEGIANAAMLYDRHKMQALFQLQIGNPGSSFAVEIARKIGIPEDVIEDASRLVGSEYIAADKYLQDIVRDKRYWESKRQTIHQREKQMEQTIQRYEHELSELDKQRKEVLAEAKRQAEELLRSSNARIENTIKSIKEAQAEREKTKEMRQELTDFQQQIDDLEKAANDDRIAMKMRQIAERKERHEQRRKAKQQKKSQSPVLALPGNADSQIADANRPLAVGDTVRIKGQTSVGVLTELDGKNAFVTFGMMRTLVPLKRLERAQAPKAKDEPRAATYVSKQTQDSIYERKLQFHPELDVRGMRGDEALTAVTYFIDDAILLSVSRVRILHGTGTGALRQLIRQYLATVPSVQHYHDEHVQFGGAGITVVEM